MWAGKRVICICLTKCDRPKHVENRKECLVILTCDHLQLHGVHATIYCNVHCFCLILSNCGTFNCMQQHCFRALMQLMPEQMWIMWLLTIRVFLAELIVLFSVCFSLFGTNKVELRLPLWKPTMGYRKINVCQSVSSVLYFNLPSFQRTKRCKKFAEKHGEWDSFMYANCSH